MANENIASAAKDGAKAIASLAHDKTRGAASAVALKTAEKARNALDDVFEQSDEVNDAETASSVGQSTHRDREHDGSARQNGKNPKGKLPVVAVAGIAVALVVAVVWIGIIGPSDTGRFTKDDFVSTSALEKAIDVDELSTAEFVYNGVAEKLRERTRSNPLFLWESDDPVEYKILYKATVRAQVAMSDVLFDVDKESKTVTITLPAVSLSPSVKSDGIKFIPVDTDANPKDVLEICEEDVLNEAQNSAELQDMAVENLKATIEALTMPIVGNSGYAIEWKETPSNSEQSSESDELQSADDAQADNASAAEGA